MREKFRSQGFEINTKDINNARSADFDVHLDLQIQHHAKKCYLLLLETPQIFPPNGRLEFFNRYQKIFTWNDDLVDGKRFIKINYPNTIQVHSLDGYTSRRRFCCLIAGNKTLSTNDSRNLYPERVKVIRWFEQNAPHDFDLFGVGWGSPVLQSGVIGKIQRRAFGLIGRWISSSPFPSYRGRIELKAQVMTRTRFAICYENVRDIPGYITEKIFDCFFSGCVPVYWGANNIADHIPADCFIDRRNFCDTAEVYSFLKAITEQEFIGYQKRIANFLRSDAAYPFSSECFAETIVSAVVEDIGI